MNSARKKWLFGVLISVCIILSCFAGLVVYVDPFFHYHKPLENRVYSMEDQRYINDGLAKRYDYDALITGSSMSENFRPSELTALFGKTGIKLPLVGGSYKEVDMLVQAACENNKNLSMVIRGLDFNRILNKKDDVDYEYYPEYLYDNNIFNDTKYVFNMSVIMRSLQTFMSVTTPEAARIDFDAYSMWTSVPSRQAVEAYYHRSTLTLASTQISLTQQELDDLQEQIDQNVIATALKYPDVEFYYYITPYSIAYWDYYRMEGNLERQLEAEEYLIEALLPYENIHLFSFHLQHEEIENLDNYYDVAHHSPELSSKILQWMQQGTGLLTQDNYKEYLEEEHNYYRNFDYEAYFAGWPN